MAKSLITEQKDIQDITLRLLNNLAFCDENEIPILNSGVVFSAIDLLSSEHDDISRQAIMLLSNLALNRTFFDSYFLFFVFKANYTKIYHSLTVLF